MLVSMWISFGRYTCALMISSSRHRPPHTLRRTPRGLLLIPLGLTRDHSRLMPLVTPVQRPASLLVTLFRLDSTSLNVGPFSPDFRMVCFELENMELCAKISICRPSSAGITNHQYILMCFLKTLRIGRVDLLWRGWWIACGCGSTVCRSSISTRCRGSSIAAMMMLVI